MPTFTIKLSHDSLIFGEMTVEADSFEHAMELAEQKKYDDEVMWAVSEPEFVDSDDQPEVTEIILDDEGYELAEWPWWEWKKGPPPEIVPVKKEGESAAQ